MKGVQYTSYEHHSLKKAVWEGRIERVREIISSRSLYYSREWSDASDGYALLCTAVIKKHREIVKLLLTNGSRVNSENDNSSETPLHFAVENGDIEIIQMLLDKDANINTPNIVGRTPFDLAFLYSKIEIIRIFLNRGASVEPTSIWNVIPMHSAVTIGREEIEIINLLLSKGANVNIKCNKGQTALHSATMMGYSRIVEHLLTHGAYVNACDNKGYTPLHLAAETWNKDVIKFLLFRGAESTSVHIALQKRKVQIAEHLLKYGANVNAEAKDGETSLHIALFNGHEQIAEHLINYGANVNTVYNTSGREEGYTPLHLAAETCSEEIIKLLLSKGANVNAEAKDGTTSLHVAVRYGKFQIANHLLKCRANVNAVCSSENKEGYTPLHLAVEGFHLNIIKLLLKFGASINSTDDYGRTALHIASKNPRKEVVMALLEHGSDTTIMSKENYTALDLAMNPEVKFDNNYLYRNYDRVNVVKILQRHMVKIKVANLYALNKDMLSISKRKFGMDDKELSEFQNECKKEIACMKSEVINDNITFYDILTGSVRLLARYATNESIVEAFRYDNYEIKFPIYDSMIKKNFRKGLKEKEFMEKGDQIFGFLFSKNLPWLPPECTEKILSYLNYEDLI